MGTKIKHYIFFALFVSLCSYAQTSRIKGVILDEYNNPIGDVNISSGNKTTTSDATGFYQLIIESNKKVTVTFQHVSMKKSAVTVELKPNEDYEFNLVMNDNTEQMGEVVVINNKKRVEGVITIEPEIIRNIPGANAGIESILKTLPGVYSNNELSTQYNVRGGNYDENLVYVDEVQIYRPFLVRSGQQEGLSFTNTNLVKNVEFYPGGFPAKYGDKTSSVLDITYRTPTKFGGQVDLSFLGAGLSVDAVSKNQKWAGVLGFRYRDNSILVGSQETEAEYNPRFADIQTKITFTPSTKWQFSFLGNIAQNIYDYKPLSRQTNFGTLQDPVALLIFYEGQEIDTYQTYFGAIKATYDVNESFKLKFIVSTYQTIEQEYFDIMAAYSLGEIDSNIGSETFGNVTYSRAIGSQLDHARNNLDALITNAELKGFNEIKKNQIEWGFKFTRENVRDRIIEWEVIDSAGFSLNPPIKFLPKNEQPYEPYEGPLVPYQSVSSTNNVNIDSFSGYAQWSLQDFIGENKVWYNAGIRVSQWQVTGENLKYGDFSGDSQITVSPRAQFAIKPNWEKDMVFTLSGGVYNQPPSYRELRDYDGIIQPNVQEQNSWQILLSNDYSFAMWKRRFKLMSSVFYKSMTNVNPYTLDNVRIRYAAENNAVAYAQGFDIRLNGDFVPHMDSWFSFGYLKTEENIDDRGYIARPTDQRLQFAILFQDYMPKFPSLKVYLNLVYNTGLPGGSPSYADPYDYQQRLNDYRRADIGFSYVFTEKNASRPPSHWLTKLKYLALGFEVFNLFNNQNAITNTWVRDAYSKAEYAVPNYMTGRVFNLKLSVNF